jgi:GNAT superfamily N-acetyltransferase
MGARGAGDKLLVALDGVTDLPPGKIAAVVTWLAMSAPPPRPAPQGGPEPVLERLGAQAIARYLALYRMLGARWLWFSRLVMPAGHVARILGDPGVAAFAVGVDGRDVGLLELDARAEDETELAFLGVAEEWIGRGLGRRLMNRAMAMAFSRPIRRFFVHTCTFDHPGAPEFYRRSGFAVEKISLEIVDDPRLSGHLPREAAPHVPLIVA